MAKRSAKKSSGAKHKSFTLSSHSYRQDMVMLYVVIAILVGLGIGWFFQDQIISMLGGNPMMY